MPVPTRILQVISLISGMSQGSGPIFPPKQIPVVRGLRCVPSALALTPSLGITCQVPMSPDRQKGTL